PKRHRVIAASEQHAVVTRAQRDQVIAGPGDRQTRIIQGYTFVRTQVQVLEIRERDGVEVEGAAAGQIETIVPSTADQSISGLERVYSGVARIHTAATKGDAVVTRAQIHQIVAAREHQGVIAGAESHSIVACAVHRQTRSIESDSFICAQVQVFKPCKGD